MASPGSWPSWIDARRQYILLVKRLLLLILSFVKWFMKLYSLAGYLLFVWVLCISVCSAPAVYWAADCGGWSENLHQLESLLDHQHDVTAAQTQQNMPLRCLFSHGLLVWPHWWWCYTLVLALKVRAWARMSDSLLETLMYLKCNSGTSICIYVIGWIQESLEVSKCLET